MILKGNARENGQDLARHLTNTRENDSVEIAEISGFVADDLHGAFAETEAIASGTQCQEYLYSLSINPSEPLTREQYAHAINRTEKRLGLEGQPRAVVFHVKDGREHCHVAWSRIDGETMKARPLPFDRQKLRNVSRELGREFGHSLPDGLANDRGVDRFSERFNDVSHAEKSQAERSGLDPHERRAIVTQAYRQADSGLAFAAALQDKGLILAKGDRRGLVLVDQAGDVHGLSRQIEGAKARDIRDTLKLDALTNLPSVQGAKDIHAANARQNVQGRPQDSFDALQRVGQAEVHLTSLTKAQSAEIAAAKGHLSDDLRSIKSREGALIKEMTRMVKESYRPEWAALFKRQREEMQAVTDLKKSPLRRLHYILAHTNMDKFDRGARGHLAKAFNWLVKTKPGDRTASLREQAFPQEIRGDVRKMFKFVVKGDMDFKKLEKTHLRERRELGNMQKLALGEEIRAVKADAVRDRASRREDHQHDMAALRRDHKVERSQAERDLQLARGVADKAGISRKPKASRLNSFLMQSYTAKELDSAKDSARKDLQREKEQDRARGDDGARTMKP